MVLYPISSKSMNTHLVVLPLDMVKNSSSLCTSLLADFFVSGQSGQVVPTERLYILTLGSQQGNRHVHWHLAPLPPGVPYEQQQTAALDLSKGVLAIPDEEMASLARSIRQALEQLSTSSASLPSD
jgi:hypothetical protein